MIISKKAIRELENAGRRVFSSELKRYLLEKYSREPFPYEYSEQDLLSNIAGDVHAYYAGNLDVTAKSLSERRREDREHLECLCIDSLCKIRDLEEYIGELEGILSKHGLESSRMAEYRRIGF